MIALPKVLLGQRPDDRVGRIWSMELLPGQGCVCRASRHAVSELLPGNARGKEGAHRYGPAVADSGSMSGGGEARSEVRPRLIKQ
jgi:hypothetical protein